MKKITLYICIVLVFAGCKHGQKSNIKIQETKIDSVAFKDSLFKVDLIQKEGVRAIGNINFFISEKEFEKQAKIFKDPLYHTDIYDSGYFIGEYNFSVVNGSFYNDSLFTVHIWGNKVRYSDYNNKMKGQYEALCIILSEKYGMAEYKNELPDTYSIKDRTPKMLAEWNLGFKKILVWVISFGSEYRLDFALNVPDMAKKNLKYNEERKRIENLNATKAL